MSYFSWRNFIPAVLIGGSVTALVWSGLNAPINLSEIVQAFIASIIIFFIEPRTIRDARTWYGIVLLMGLNSFATLGLFLAWIVARIANGFYIGPIAFLVLIPAVLFLEFVFYIVTLIQKEYFNNS